MNKAATTNPAAKITRRAATVKPTTGKTAAKKTVAKKLLKPTAITAAIPPRKKPELAVPEKVKLVRDSFTLPEVDHELIKRCKKAAVASGRETKKSEVVRAAIQTFSALSLELQLKAYKALSPIAVGRPKSK